MSPVLKVFLSATVVAVMLFFGIDKFLGGTEKLAASLDLRSLAYTRDDRGSSKGRKADDNAVKIKVLNPSEPAPDRDGESVTIGRFEAENPDDELDTEETDEDVESEEESEEDTESEEKKEQEEEEEEKRAERDRAAEEADEDDSDERGASVELDSEAVDAEESGETDEAGEAGDSDKATGDAEELAEGEEVAEVEETPAEARARELKEKLGIKVPKPPTRAVDVLLVPSEDCDPSGVDLAPVSIAYRFESPTVKSASLQQLELLVAEYRRCPSSVFQITENSLGSVDASPTLTQMRFDELKYFFIQHSVSKTALRYPKQP